MAPTNTGLNTLVVLACLVVLCITATTLWTVDDDARIPKITADINGLAIQRSVASDPKMRPAKVQRQLQQEIAVFDFIQATQTDHVFRERLYFDDPYMPCRYLMHRLRSLEYTDEEIKHFLNGGQLEPCR